MLSFMTYAVIGSDQVLRVSFEPMSKRYLSVQNKFSKHIKIINASEYFF